ncbi:MAG: hypothetical protein WAN86_21920 [Hyphomicrobiaceae bacterium]
MTEHTLPTTPPPKWWVASKTLWGAFITALVAVLPALGPLLGFTVPAELIHQLGDQVLLVVQALVGLAGIVLTIYGRVRATTPLERRRVIVKL